MRTTILKSSPLVALLLALHHVAIAEDEAKKKPNPAADVAKPAGNVEEPPVATAVDPLPGAAKENKAGQLAIDEDPVLPPLLDPDDLSAIQPVPQKPGTGVAFQGDQINWQVTLKEEGLNIELVNLAGISLFADRRQKASEAAQNWEKEQKDVLKPGVMITDGLMTPDPEGLRMSLKKFLGKPATYKDLQDMVEIIQDHYRRHNRPMTHVYIPKQSLFSDRVVISIVEGRVGQTMILTEADVRSKPQNQLSPAEKNYLSRMDENKTWWNSWYNNPYKAKDVTDEFLPRTQQLQGRVVDTEEIKAQITGMNRSPWARLNRPVDHPFRDVTVNFSQPAANELGKTDLIFEVDDKRPVKFFAGADNSLTEITGENRIFMGAAWYDAFLLGRNHQLGAQLFSGFDPEELTGFSLNYQIPWQFQKSDQFTEMFFSYADSTVGSILGGVPTDSTGTSFIYGARHYLELPEMFGANDLTQPLGTLNPHKWAKSEREAMGLHHEVGLGFDFKSSDNNLLFGGTTVSETPSDIVQLALEYNVRQTDPTGETNLTSQMFFSPGDVTDDNTSETFQLQRFAADASYTYAKLRLERDQDLPFSGMFGGMMVRAALTGQYSSTNLLASEQLGLGGFGSVRGYPERALRGDMGYILNLELYSPEFHPVSQFTDWSWLNQDTLKFLIFFDYAHGSPSEENPDDPLDDSADLMSVGVGVRYEIEDTLGLRLDYGIRLEDLPEAAENSDGGAVHFGLVYMF